ncbi:RING-H2 finger protein ATL39-like [Papaver somniferum]|uniref:RING-H2 finger protein ATL39-like n=1 Tax=Papaver somniferum TaxID=3469 RepID=UPI000E7022D3|nr:RING-H2 finger protein ATL39-like [Papaver somniferum]
MSNEKSVMVEKNNNLLLTILLQQLLLPYASAQSHSDAPSAEMKFLAIIILSVWVLIAFICCVWLIRAGISYIVAIGKATEKQLLDSKEIQALPESVYSAVKNKEEVQEKCSVCLSEYENEDMLRFLPCRHAFHTECIDEWLVSRTTCPYCRSDLLVAIVPETTLIASDVRIDVTEDAERYGLQEHLLTEIDEA